MPPPSSYNPVAAFNPVAFVSGNEAARNHSSIDFLLHGPAFAFRSDPSGKPIDWLEAERKLEDVTRQRSAARREPLPAPPQESRPLLRTGQQDTEVRIRVSACSKGLRRNGLDQVPLDVLLEQRYTLDSIEVG